MNDRGIEAAARARLAEIWHDSHLTEDELRIMWERKTEVEREAFRSMVRPIVAAYLAEAGESRLGYAESQLRPSGEDLENARKLAPMWSER